MTPLSSVLPRGVRRLFRFPRSRARMLRDGVVIGAAAAIGVTRGPTSMLYGVSPGDPITLIAIALLVGAIALLVSYVPARRALRVDPTQALRAE